MKITHIYILAIATLCYACIDTTNNSAPTTPQDTLAIGSTDPKQEEVRNGELTITIFPNKFSKTTDTIMEYTISNNTSQEFNFGSRFRMDKKVDDLWEQVPYVDRLVFNDILYIVKAGESIRESIYISTSLQSEHITGGHYRIVKDVYPAAKRDSIVPLIAEFDME